MREFNEAVLPCGLKIIHELSPTETVYCGLFVDAGTRDEQANDFGLAHFCEHTSFKGTSRRKSWHIRNCLERVGGDLNAYTNKEETVYYAAVRKEDFDRAADLLFDIVFHSKYPQSELTKETEVIIDEIDSYNDSPAELIYDEFEEMLFRGHGLGRNILGTAERLRQYTTADALRFTRQYYRPDNVTFFVYGNTNFKHILKVVQRLCEDLNYDSPLLLNSQELPEYQPEERWCSHNTHQAHVLLGNRGYSSKDPRRSALYLLNNIIGGPGMNSLLNVTLREKHGLVYTTESTAFSYTDAGVWTVYFGCDEKNVKKCRQLVINLLNRLCDKPLTPIQLSRAKKQIIGQMRIASDSFESYALALGKTYAHSGKHRDVDKLCQRVMDITASELLDVAQDIFCEKKLTMLVYQ